MDTIKIKTGSVTIKKVMEDRGIKVSKLAALLTERGFDISSNVLSSKLHRDTFSLNEYVMIADILDCDVKTISRIDNTEYKIEFDEEKEIQKKKNNAKK